MTSPSTTPVGLLRTTEELLFATLDAVARYCTGFASCTVRSHVVATLGASCVSALGVACPASTSRGVVLSTPEYAAIAQASFTDAPRFQVYVAGSLEAVVTTWT